MRDIHPVLVKLRRRQRVSRRQISKINGTRNLIEYGFIQGDTWWASSNEWSLSSRLEQLKEKEMWEAMPPDERNHRLLLKNGWRLVEPKITTPN